MDLAITTEQAHATTPTDVEWQESISNKQEPNEDKPPTTRKKKRDSPGTMAIKQAKKFERVFKQMTT